MITPAVEALHNGEQRHAGAQQQQQDLSHDGIEAYISAAEAFEGFTHQEIYEGVQEMPPGVMQQFGDDWVTIAAEVSGAMLCRSGRTN
ncbi:Uncharacterised protein [Nocardia farcinica]|uniref:Uncharacterized protein n=1 Tax=Nocardia farcinica TaxID=37329 RepID=A0A449GIS6_NOCFR|nr:hypothetical protein [Nocardia farcinica]VFA92507.1 Uncharacterised protein [Nocardia farcinica]